MMIRKRTTKTGYSYEYSFEIASIGGTRKRISKSGFATRSEAQKAGQQAYYEYHNGGYTQKQKMSYHDFAYKVWIVNDCECNLKQTTIVSYKKILKNKIIPLIGNYYIDELDKEKLQRAIINLYDKGYSIHSLEEVRGLLSKSFRYASENHYIKSNPAVNLSIPKNRIPVIETRKNDNVYIENDIMTKIFNLVKDKKQYSLPIRLGYECGLRHAEIFGLVWEDIDFVGKTIKVNRQIDYYQDDSRTDEDKKKGNGSKNCGNSYWYYKQPKYNSYRIIEISDELVNILKAEKLLQEQKEQLYKEYYQRYYTAKPLSFKNTKSNPDSVSINKISSSGNIEIHPVLRYENGTMINPRITQTITHLIKQNVTDKFTFHSLRHTHTTVLLSNKVDIKYVSERLGHSSIAITMDIYSHLSIDMKKQAHEQINDIFGGNEGNWTPASTLDESVDVTLTRVIDKKSNL